MDPDTKEFDIDIIEAGTSHSQRERIRSIKEIIKRISEENDDDWAPRDDVLEMAEDNGIEAEKVQKELDQLKTKGEIYEPRNERFRVSG